MPRPKTELPDTIYTNFDHTFNEKVEAMLADNKSTFAQHAAWDFCGYIYREGEQWHNDIWQYNSFVETVSGPTCLDVIKEANEHYGSK